MFCCYSYGISYISLVTRTLLFNCFAFKISPFCDCTTNTITMVPTVSICNLFEPPSSAYSVDPRWRLLLFFVLELDPVSPTPMVPQTESHAPTPYLPGPLAVATAPPLQGLFVLPRQGTCGLGPGRRHRSSASGFVRPTTARHLWTWPDLAAAPPLQGVYVLPRQVPAIWSIFSHSPTRLAQFGDRVAGHPVAHRSRMFRSSIVPLIQFHHPCSSPSKCWPTCTAEACVTTSGFSATG